MTEPTAEDSMTDALNIICGCGGCTAVILLGIIFGILAWAT